MSEVHEAPYRAIVEEVADNLGMTYEQVDTVMDEYQEVSSAHARRRIAARREREEARKRLGA